MKIRRAELADLNGCLALDRSFDTDHVWQMDERERGDELSVTFRTVRLPRPMRVQAPGPDEGLLQNWQEDACFLVADDAGAPVAFIDVAVPPGADIAWVRNLVVDKRLRRKRVGSALMAAAVQWAEGQSVRGLAAAVQTKNYPGIAFCQRFGMSFSGFNDQHFANQDIAIYFVRPLH